MTQIVARSNAKRVVVVVPWVELVVGLMLIFGIRVRAAALVCRRVAAKQSRSDIERELARRATSDERRATSMMPTGTMYRIDTRNSPIGGSPEAKVTLVAYLCPRCPYCAQLEPELYQSVIFGKLKGKVKLYVRLFPVRSHAGSTEAVP